MAMLYVIDAKGDPAQLLAQYDQAGRAFTEKAAELKRKGAGSHVIAHICVETQDGIQIIHLMEEMEAPLSIGIAAGGKALEKGQTVAWLQRRGLVDETQRGAVRDAGLLSADYSEAVYRVHNYSVLRT